MGLTWCDLAIRAAPVQLALARDAWCDPAATLGALRNGVQLARLVTTAISGHRESVLTV
jgi:hypothetical protein